MKENCEDLAASISHEKAAVRTANGKNYTDGYKGFDTVEKIFAFVEKEAAKKPYILSVKYDSEFGYPGNIVLDGAKEIADDELSLKIANLEVIR